MISPTPAAHNSPREAGPPHPAGTVTLVFTDVQGSSELWETHDAAFKPVLDEHNRVLRETAARWGGFEVSTEGDAFFIAFARASDAVQFAVDAQRHLVRVEWGALLPGLDSLRVRLGMHTGEPLVDRHPDGAVDYFGPAVNRAARVSAAGHGGQVLVSDAGRAMAAPGLRDAAITFRSLGRHRLKGVGEEHIWQACHPGLPAEFPPLGTLDPRKHNLPLPASPFIGRRRELEAWERLIRGPGARLVTLAGFGGVGKTRAALQLAEQCVGAFADGVWWTALEEVRTAEAMVQRIAYQLRVPLQPAPSVREQLFAHIAERDLLLVLDNTEQIPKASELISSLLQHAPRIRCLVTSRHGLNLRAERLIEMEPLAQPDAVSLFEERATARRGDYGGGWDTRADVARLCRELEGVPLAIELAASRIASLTPHEMLERLSERFHLLRNQEADVPLRQRALRATLDWSYELLAPEEQELLACLSVFHGGFSLEAAEVVCPNFDALDGVAELRRHSLLRAEVGADPQHTRYRMLEVMRRYAAERLEQSALRHGVEQRHAAYFVRFGEARTAQVRTGHEGPALRELDADFDNLRGAMRWARDSGAALGGARLALVLQELLHRRGFWADAARCHAAARDFLDRAGLPEAELRARLALAEASLAVDTGHYAEARAKGEACLALRRAAGDAAGEADALNMVGLVALYEAHFDEADCYLRRALELLPPPAHRLRGNILHNLGNLAYRRYERGGVPEKAAGLLNTARECYEEALVSRRAAGDARGEAETLGGLGNLGLLRGEAAESARLYQSSRQILSDLGDTHGMAVMLQNLGEAAELRGDLEGAASCWLNAERIFADLRSVYAPYTAGFLARAAASLGPARLAELRALADAASNTPPESPRLL